MDGRKKRLREQMLSRLKKMDDALFQKRCLMIRRRLFAAPEWKKAGSIALTLSVGREVDTYEIVRQAWAEGKKVAVPKCEPKNRLMTFYRLNGFHQLEKGYFGLFEPKIAETVRVEPRDLDLAIVPGVVFDRRGFRIGYGGGYYDRFLSEYSGMTVSLLFDAQLVETVPTEGHDRRVACLITERESFSPRMNRQ
ncbi:5-formyltetrahydrofolate cyclo-ligase [Sporolactobacillus sp. THM7-7]|nr:5-formyltetrahydrofolate cyclo-ligase [Sporolactobacillus sp. THM7-7]